MKTNPSNPNNWTLLCLLFSPILGFMFEESIGSSNEIVSISQSIVSTGIFVIIY
jgi:hypothetical protein